MTPEEIRDRIPSREFIFLTSRSSGPGGQNVNKVNTKIEVRFNVRLSDSLSAKEKELVLNILKNRINSTGELVIKSQSERTQLQNRKKALERMFYLIAGALTEGPGRKPTSPTIKSQSDRVDAKKKRGRIKRMRQEDHLSDNDL